MGVYIRLSELKELVGRKETEMTTERILLDSKEVELELRVPSPEGGYAELAVYKLINADPDGLAPCPGELVAELTVGDLRRLGAVLERAEAALALARAEAP